MDFRRAIIMDRFLCQSDPINRERKGKGQMAELRMCLWRFRVESKQIRGMFNEKTLANSIDISIGSVCKVSLFQKGISWGAYMALPFDILTQK